MDFEDERTIISREDLNANESNFDCFQRNSFGNNFTSNDEGASGELDFDCEPEHGMCFSGCDLNGVCEISLLPRFDTFSAIICCPSYISFSES